MAQLPVIIRDKVQEEEFALEIAERAIERYEAKRGFGLEKDRRIPLDALMETYFPFYNKRTYKDPIKAEIRAGKFGEFDVFNKYTASYNEVDSFIFNRKNKRK
jgi:hypothetical protein